MTEREKDLKRLELMSCGRQLSAAPILIILACTAVVFVIALVSSGQGNSTAILPALLMVVVNIFMIIQQFVARPLIREIQRLRADLEEIGKNKREG